MVTYYAPSVIILKILLMFSVYLASNEHLSPPGTGTPRSSLAPSGFFSPERIFVLLLMTLFYDLRTEGFPSDVRASLRETMFDFGL